MRKAMVAFLFLLLCSGVSLAQDPVREQSQPEQIPVAKQSDLMEHSGMQVPKGGSMCANCKYLDEDKKSCTKENFIRWNGSEVIPGKIDEYCSDWYEPKEKL